MTGIETIAAYRAAAAKLGEALAATQEHTALDLVTTICSLLGGTTPEAETAWILASLTAYTEFPASWRWLVEAAQLRLLVDAAILEQEGRPDQPRCTAWRVAIEYQAELGSLVRQWQEGATPSPTATTTAGEVS